MRSIVDAVGDLLDRAYKSAHLLNFPKFFLIVAIVVVMSV